MKACCTGSGCSREPRPSSVTMSRPLQPSIGITQDRAATPSISTAQAPHSPRPQPYFGPFKARSLRSTCSSGVDGAAGVHPSTPFTRSTPPELPAAIAVPTASPIFGQCARLLFVYKRSYLDEPLVGMADAGLDRAAATWIAG